MDIIQISGTAIARTHFEMDSQELLRAAHLRLTAPRLAVLEALVALGPHQSAEAIASEARSRLGTLSTQAVYDNLRALTEAGIVRRFDVPQAATLYELNAGQIHHHFVCRSCGETKDVPGGRGESQWLQALESQGFAVDEVTLRGVCSRCQQQVLAEPNTSGGNNEQADN